jgi:hypothetical protein
MFYRKLYHIQDEYDFNYMHVCYINKSRKTVDSVYILPVSEVRSILCLATDLCTECYCLSRILKPVILVWQ